MMKRRMNYDTADSCNIPYSIHSWGISWPGKLAFAVDRRFAVLRYSLGILVLLVIYPHVYVHTYKHNTN